MSESPIDWPECYRRLGVRPVINAQSWVTSLGGSLMHPDVLRAMGEAAAAFVDMTELNRAAGRVVARACGAESGLVTAGCAAAEVLMVAACMTGRDPARVEQLPRSRGMKNEVVMFKGQRNRYDGAFRIPGARIVEYGAAADARDYQLDAAITDRTCAVAYVIGPFIHAGIGLEETVRVAHARGVPVIVDAAAELPPRDNLTRFIALGADLVAFSGGKGIGGPQSAGLLAGRADLVEAAFANSLNLDSPQAGIGRPMKASKEDIVGMVTALERFLALDEAQLIEGWRAKAEHVAERLGAIEGLRVTVEDTPVHRQGPQPVIYFDTGWTGPTPAAVRAALLAGDPPIHVGVGGYADEINVVMTNLRDGEERIVADALSAVLDPAARE